MRMEEKKNLRAVITALTKSLKEADDYMKDPDNKGEVKTLEKSICGYQLKENVSSMLKALGERAMILFDFYENDTLYNDTLTQLQLIKSSLYDAIAKLIEKENHGCGVVIPSVSVTGRHIDRGYTSAVTIDIVSVDKDGKITVHDSENPFDHYYMDEKGNDEWTLLIIYKHVKLALTEWKGGKEDGHERD